MNKIVGKVKIEHNLEFIINVYGDDILNNLLEKILVDMSESRSTFTSEVEYQDCYIDDRETKCYFIKLFVDKDSELSDEKIENNLRKIVVDLMKMYRRDRVYLEMPSEEGEWIFLDRV